MTSLEQIQDDIERSVSTDEIVRRMFVVARTSHIKSASYNHCDCGYCSAIKDYVRAKRTHHKLDMVYNWSWVKNGDQRLRDFDDSQIVLMAKKGAKDRAKAAYLV